MKDRLVFQETKLDNGIRIFAYPMDVPFASLVLTLPLGHVHNTEGITPGSVHLLEHMTLHRSNGFPERDALSKKIELNGGDMGGATAFRYIEYSFSVAAPYFAEDFKAFFDQIFHPVFIESDLILDRDIISNERKRKMRWYPGGNELEQYMMKQWMDDENVSLRQRLGEDADLATITIDALKTLHQNYCDPRLYVFVGGQFDLSLVIDAFSKLHTTPHTLPIHYTPTSWVNKPYHQRAFRDVSRFVYHTAGLSHESTPDQHAGIAFICRLLTNTVHGPLYQWLREEKGWVYNLGFGIDHSPRETTWGMYFPVNNSLQVETVRQELDARIRAAIQDQKLIEREIERRKAHALFFYQTLDEIMGDAIDSVRSYGRVYSETELQMRLDTFRESRLLTDLYEKYFSPGVLGEFLAVPEEAS